MPMLAVAAMGAAIGSAVGGGVVIAGMAVSYASIGWTIGSVVGSLLFAPDGPKAQLQDTRATKLQFGAKIPRVRGRARLPLNPRWQSEWRATSQEAGGKGGGGSEYFTYSADGLFWVCEGVDGATGVRLWDNGKLIWSSLADSDDASLIASSETPKFSAITFHDGNDAQLPWPVYEAAVGTADADAHRGLFCVSIENYQGGQSPNWGLLEVEFVEAHTDGVRPIGPGTLLGSRVGSGNKVLMPAGVTLEPGDQMRIGILHRNTAAVPEWVNASWIANVHAIDHAQESSGSVRLHFFTLEAFGDGTDDLGDFTVAGDGGGPNLWFVDVMRGEVDAHWPGSFGIGDYNRTSQAGPLNPGAVTKSAGYQSVLAVAFLVSPIGGATITASPAGYTSGGVIADTVVFGGDPTEFNLQLAIAHGEYNGTTEDPGSFGDGNGSYGSGGSGTLTFAITWATTVPAITPLTVDLADVVQKEQLRCGLTADKLDNTELEGIPVTGWVFNSSGRDSLEGLAAWWYFGATSRDKLITRLRGAASAVTIPWLDTGHGLGQPGKLFTGTDRGNDKEVPAFWVVSTPDIENNYETGTEDSARMVTSSVERRQVQLQAVATPQERKGRANAFALDAEVGSHKGQLFVGDDYAQLEPFDVVTALDEDGNGYRLRIMREVTAQGIKALAVVKDDQAALPTTGNTSNPYSPSFTVAGVGVTTLLNLDIAMLRDADNDPGWYIAAYGTGDWQGAEIHESLDGTSYAKLGAITNQATAGVTTTALGNWSQPWLIDHGSSVTVSVNKPLASYSLDAMLAGTMPPYLIGDEIVYARTATLVSTGVYTLTDFVRALQGTEAFTGEHAVGERFVVLQTAGMRRGVREAGELNVEYQFKGVTIGQLVSAVTAQAFTDTGVGLKPYAPADLVGTRVPSGGYSLSCNRRTRLSSTFLGTSEIPLGEAVEAYEWDIMSGATVLRTIATSEPTCFYSPEQQVADFGALQGSVSVRVYKMSAIVGRGYPLIGTVSGGALVAQQSTITLSGAFSAGVLISVTAGATPLANYTTLIGDTDLDGAAASLAAAIDGTAGFSASSTGSVVTVDGPVGTVYALVATVGAGSAIGFNLLQPAAYANAGTSYIANLFVAEYLTGATSPIPSGVTFTVTIERPIGNQIGSISYTTTSSVTPATVHSQLSAAMAADPLFAMGYRYDVNVGTYGYFGVLTGPLGVTNFHTRATGSGSFGLSVAITNPGTAPVASDQPQIVEAAVLGTLTTGEELFVTLGGVDYSYVVLGGDTTTDAAAGLAADIDPAAAYAATSASSVVTITGPGPADPFTYTSRIDGALEAAVG